MDFNNLNEFVYDIINDWAHNRKSFTALDVSNKVKEITPYVKHRDVREVVRNMFAHLKEHYHYEKKPIDFVLNDGTAVKALLYYPIINADSGCKDYYPTRLSNELVIKKTMASSKDTWHNLHSSKKMFPIR